MFALTRRDDPVKLHGYCRRFRDIRNVGDKRVDSTAGDFSMVCICIVSKKYVPVAACHCDAAVCLPRGQVVVPSPQQRDCLS